MKGKVLRFSLGILVAVIGCVGCGRDPVLKTKEEAVVLRLGYTPSEEAVADREKAMGALALYLRRQLGVEVRLVRTASYGPAVEAMARGEIDMLGLGPFAYVLASRLGVAEVLVAVGGEDGEPRSYQSALVAHRRAGVSNLDELSDQASHLRLCFTDPASNSGHLVPQALLASLNLDPERDFAAVEFTLSHSVSIFNVLFDHADVAGVSTRVLARLAGKGRVPEEEFVTLWQSELLPSGPFAVRAALPAEIKKALREALLALPQRDPEAARAVMAQYQERNLRYVAVDESLYDGLRWLARDMVAEGR